MAMIGVKPSAPSESQSSPGTSSLNPTTVAKEPSLPPPAVPQETRPPVAPATAVLPRGMDRANFPGELVKALFADPKVADRLSVTRSPLNTWSRAETTT